MNVSLNGSLSIRPNNFPKERKSQLNKGSTFSEVISTASGKAQTDQFTRNISSTTSKTNISLKDADYEYLAAKWNPTEMTQDDYDELLDYLQNKGIISEYDKELVGYGGVVCAKTGPGSGSYSSPYKDTVNDFSDGNLLAYTRYNSSLIYEDNASNATEGKYRVNLYKTITGVLEEMLMRK